MTSESSSARKVLSTNQRQQKDQYSKKIHKEPHATGDKLWVWVKERIKLKNYFDPWEEPYAVMAKISEVIYKVTKQSTPRKCIKLLLCAESRGQPEEAAARKRPTAYLSPNSFDDPEMYVEEEALMLHLDAQSSDEFLEL